MHGRVAYLISLPDTGAINSKLHMIVTSHDTSIPPSMSLLSSVMTTSLVTTIPARTTCRGSTLLRDLKNCILPIIDAAGSLVALLARSDFLKNRNHPLANLIAASADIVKVLSLGTGA